jgi:predicted kinase
MSTLLIAMAGLPGTGKTTLAEALAKKLGAAVLDKDKLRAALIEPERIEYSRKQNDAVYELLLKGAIHKLRRGKPVILDGRTFTRKYQVERVMKFAAENDAHLRVIECVCEEALALKRIHSDKEKGTHLAADRGPELYHRLKSEAEPIEIEHLVVNTGGELDGCVNTCMEYLSNAAE